LSIDPLNLHREIKNDNGTTGAEVDVNELFVSELRAQYNMEFDNKKNLETKASSIISISGTVAALLFGFGTFLINKVSPSYDFFMYILALLMISISSITISIILSIFASRIHEYYVAADHKQFYKGKEFDEDKWEKYCYSSKNKFNRTIAKNYFKCIQHNANKNETKARYIQLAQIGFFCGLAVLPFLLAIVFSNYPNMIIDK
jgi:hypothetical protein